MGKRSKNLSLDEDVVQKAERYSELHQTSVSRLVNDFLSRLPVETDHREESISPAVRRLLGIASDRGGRDSYRTHVDKKYGS